MDGSEARGSSTLGSDPEAQSPDVGQQSSPKAGPSRKDRCGLCSVNCSLPWSLGQTSVDGS